MIRAMLAIIVALSSSAAAYQLDLDDTSARELDGETYTVIVHAQNEGKDFDPDRVSADGVRSLVQYSKANGIPRIGVIANVNGVTSQFFGEHDTDLNVSSTNARKGGHSLTFPNGRNFIVAGGNLSLCLCDGIQDILRGARKKDEPTRIFLVSDATYDSDLALDVLHTPKSKLPDLMAGHSRNGKFNLDTLEKRAGSNKDELSHYLAQTVAGQGIRKRDGSSRNEMCPYQSDHAALDTSQFQFRFFAGHHQIGSPYGDGSHQIDIVLVNSKDLGTVLPQFGVGLRKPSASTGDQSAHR